MSIRCVCRNGHVLNVKDSYAGVSGLCPLCRTRVDVPRPHRAADVSEDVILDILGKQAATAVAAAEPYEGLDSTLSGIHAKTTPKKSCERCNQEVSAGTHICPYCHTYIAHLNDFS